MVDEVIISSSEPCMAFLPEKVMFSLVCLVNGSGGAHGLHEDTRREHEREEREEQDYPLLHRDTFFRLTTINNNNCLMKIFNRRHGYTSNLYFSKLYISYHFGSIFSRGGRENNRRDESCTCGRGRATRKIPSGVEATSTGYTQLRKEWRNSRLRPTEHTIGNCVIPLRLHHVGVAVPINVGTIGVESTIDIGTLITDLLTICIYPARWWLWVGCRFYLLMRGGADLGIGSRVIIRATAKGIASSQIIAIIWHSGIDDRTTRSPEGIVIRTESPCGSRALLQRRVKAQIFIQRQKDEEDVVDSRRPTIHAHSMRDFILDIGVKNNWHSSSRRGRVGCCIYPGTSQSRVLRSFTSTVSILGIVVI